MDFEGWLGGGIFGRKERWVVGRDGVNDWGLRVKIVF